MWEWYRFCCPWCIAPKDDDARRFDGRFRYPRFTLNHAIDKRHQLGQDAEFYDVPPEGYFKAKYGCNRITTTPSGTSASNATQTSSRLPCNSRDRPLRQYKLRETNLSVSSRPSLQTSESQIPRPHKKLSMGKKNKHKTQHREDTDMD